jgi:hypothetical protein
MADCITYYVGNRLEWRNNFYFSEQEFEYSDFESRHQNIVANQEENEVLSFKLCSF